VTTDSTSLASRDSYDAIVVGAGADGLTAAAVAAAEGLGVLLVGAGT
jgi:glycerol-3-phosphate dehydrogenase